MDDPRPFVIGAIVLIAIGLVGAVLAAVFGLIDLAGLARGTKARRMALTHMSINLVGVALLVVGLIVRLSSDQDHVSILGFILTIVVLLGVGLSGWIGGLLAYRYGVRVADEATQADGYR